MSKEEAPLNACAVARRLGVGLSTLNSWLAADENRAPHQRNFHFHSYRGRKRIWSESAYLALECAIALESEPGGMLGQWRLRHATSPNSAITPAGLAALHEVLHFKAGNAHGKRTPPSDHTREAPMALAKARMP